MNGGGTEKLSLGRDEQLVRSAYPRAFLLDFGYKVTAFLNTGYHLMPDNAG